MEILKKSILVWLIYASNIVMAQNNNYDAFLKSYTFEAEKKYESAIGAINDVKTESCYECYYRLGWLNYCAGKYNESITAYKNAAEVMPAATEPLWAMVTVFAKYEKWTELEKAYLAILRLDSKNSTANYRLGLIYYYRKDYVNAKKYFDVSLNLYPTDTDALLMSAWTNYFLGSIPAAKVLFNKVIVLQPSSTSAAEGLKLVK